MSERSGAPALTRRRVLGLVAGAAASGILAAACGTGGRSSGGGDGADPPDESPARPAGWHPASHEKRPGGPDYEAVFPADRVSRMTIRIAPGDWSAMLDDMTRRFGPRGSRQGGGVRPADNPAWSRARIEVGGLAWTNVGVRFKGNSSLRDGWAAGVDRLPFKLDFDEWEDDHPEVAGQRFYGFKQLSLANNFRDPSHMRENLAVGLLDRAGLVAARAAPYEVILDRGEGETNLGLYTVVEVIDDTVIERAFADASGNIYEGEGDGASFADGAGALIESSFEPEGGDNPDWSDIRALYDHLHSPLRSTDPAAWRTRLEAVFDVDAFLDWLGLAAALEHWDSYGQHARNYYLYNDPASGRLTWISWDHNHVLGVGPVSGHALATASFDKSRVGERWPLVRYLLDQPEYAGRYLAGLRRIADRVFVPAQLHAEVERRAALLAPFAGEPSAYESAVDELLAAIDARAEALARHLAAA